MPLNPTTKHGSRELDADAAKLEAMGMDPGPTWLEIFDDDDAPVCQTCQGSGIVNPLTAPPGVLCITSMTCPHCEGSGNDNCL